MATPCDENVMFNHATLPPSDTLMIKRPRNAKEVSSRRACIRVFDVETLLQRLLLLLDLPTVGSLLEVLVADGSWRSVLRENKLWKKMLWIHFGGDLPPIEQLHVVAEQEETEEEEEEEQEEEEEEQEEPDLVEIVEANMDIEEDDSLVGEEGDDENQNSDPDMERSTRPGAANRAKQSSQNSTDAIARSVEVPSVNWINAGSSQLVHEAACFNLKNFLRSAEQLVHFHAHVQIVRGDLGTIQTVGNQQIDGLAFPTAPFLRDPHTGTASVIFRRAGQGLRDYVSTLNVRLDVGEAHATPGFDAGVDRLIHCVGPNGFNPHCMRDLQQTYRSVLQCVQAEKLNCVAMASISTGNMGLPVDTAAWYATCAIQRYMRSTEWTATLAIVCHDADVYAAFVESKTRVMNEFNAENLRVTPPLRNR